MKAAFVRAPFQFQIRNVEMGTLGDNAILVDVRACGVSASDLEAARATAGDWQPIGHEVAGVVAAVGRAATGIPPGQKVVVHAGPMERNDMTGFAERTMVPRGIVYPFEGISFTAAALVEPFGAALDLVSAAEIGWGDDVLVIGTGTVGLMALRLARLRGARRIYAAQRSGARRRIELAREFGADEVILTDEIRLRDARFLRGGADRVLITAPPVLIPEALAVTNAGGIVAYVGSEGGERAIVSFDAAGFRLRKLQLRGAGAAPASVFPRCIELIQAGIVNAERLVSHTFQLAELPQAFRIMRDDRQNRVKLVMVKD